MEYLLLPAALLAWGLTIAGVRGLRKRMTRPRSETPPPPPCLWL
jgi:hypothetical protein